MIQPPKHPTDKKPKKVLPALHYKTPSGREPVRDWLRRLPEEERDEIGKDIADVEYNWPQLYQGGILRHLAPDIWELKTILRNTISRILFAAEEGHMIILHGFKKKARKCPGDDRALAIKRLKEIRRHYEQTKK
jgi:phage-related protein